MPTNWSDWGGVKQNIQPKTITTPSGEVVDNPSYTGEASFASGLRLQDGFIQQQQPDNTWSTIGQSGALDRDQSEAMGVQDQRVTDAYLNAHKGDPVADYLASLPMMQRINNIGQLDYRATNGDTTATKGQAFDPETYWGARTGNAAATARYNAATSPDAESDGEGGLGPLGGLLGLGIGFATGMPWLGGAIGGAASGGGLKGALLGGALGYAGGELFGGGGSDVTSSVAGKGLLTADQLGLATLPTDIGATASKALSSLGGDAALSASGAGLLGGNSAGGLTGTIDGLGTTGSLGSTGITGSATGTLTGSAGALGSTTGAAGLTGTIPGIGTLTADGMLVPAAGGASVSLSSVSPSIASSILDWVKANPSLAKLGVQAIAGLTALAGNPSGDIGPNGQAKNVGPGGYTFNPTGFQYQAPSAAPAYSGGLLFGRR